MKECNIIVIAKADMQRKTGLNKASVWTTSHGGKSESEAIKNDFLF